MTTKILVITSSILGGNSQALADHLVAQAARRDDLSVTRRDLVADDLPHLGLAELGSWQVDAAERSAEQQALAARSDALIEELNAHDQVVLAVPMYNFGVPSQLKAWFDRVMRAGVTFRYTENGPQGLVEGKRALLLLARGGQYVGTPMDTQTPHLKAMLGMIGISEVDSIFAEGLNMGHQEAAMGEAKTAIEQWVAQL
ncbi:FMN-dependent NADH-azoreductase [Bisbaumannia pacifica]|uniref:FMN dependent NADH:quinone oxidoreductase n=1 Tax=Bisbaumannia pacifica TaxID=77098 RepID=A0A510X5L4_9GAMM|nr:NAD(P)H-dependent oxidoreductase [Halomonas pacifica]GEK46718.1 FMN-dependent NADH-azoreductase [Halomonas pacifica]